MLEQSAIAPELAAPRARVRRDRAATWVVRGGGLAVVGSLLAILVFLVVEVLPLFGRAELTPAGVIEAPGSSASVLLVDEHRSHVLELAPDGRLRVWQSAGGRLAEERPLIPGAEVVSVGQVPGEPILTAALRDGRIALVRVAFRLRYDGRRRVVSPEVSEPRFVDVQTGSAAVEAFTARDADERITAVAALDDGSVSLGRISIERNTFTGARRESVEHARLTAPGRMTRLALTPDQRHLYGATDDGRLAWWVLGSSEQPSQVQSLDAPATVLSFLNGGRSLVVGQQDGGLGVWFRVSRGSAHVDLVRAQAFEAQSGAIRAIAPATRDRSFLALSEGGELGLYHSTSGRRLWSGVSPLAPAEAIAYAPKGDAALVAGPDAIAWLDVRNPHPEASLASLFRPVWYEERAEPEYVWQSTGGSDEFEPKLSLVPLLAGTLKGTLYALLFAMPLGILGAIYTSQFMHPRLQAIVKPIVEIMASLPSVVLGFLAGLWLAPRLERVFPGLLLMGVSFPLLTLLAGASWKALPRRMTGRVREGGEIVFYALVLAGGLALCFWASVPFEQLAFDGSFATWLRERTGLTYDQRNAIVAGIAMGFAVTPILFAISEDALSNVPRSLSAASLALGATRWQTVARVVLPAASPGLFAAVMIGFGRAVGETMIVLMATGNTPIIDWNPFNGFRTLSANIAVEIPEAPHGGTLYRTLFASGLLLFLVTFLVNTSAELVRERLRRRYAGS